MSLYEIEEHIGAIIEEGVLPTDQEYRESKRAAELKLFAVKRVPREHGHKKTHVTSPKSKVEKPIVKPIKVATATPIKPEVAAKVVLKPVVKPVAETSKKSSQTPVKESQSTVKSASKRSKVAKSYSKEEVAKVIANYQSKGKIQKKESIFVTLFKKIVKK
jgi:hypothetical protein